VKATDLLRQQHEEASALLDQLVAADVEDRGAVLGELSRALRAHTRIEEEIFYPRLEDEASLEDLISESFREHEELKSALGELERCEPEDPEFVELATNVEDHLDPHVAQEEADLLPKVEQIWSGDLLEEIGREMETRFDEVRRALERTGLGG
jgi:hemerythrin-like domain-containing protein